MDDTQSFLYHMQRVNAGMRHAEFTGEQDYRYDECFSNLVRVRLATGLLAPGYFMNPYSFGVTRH